MREMIENHMESLQGLDMLLGLTEKSLTLGAMPDTELAHVSLFFLSKFYRTVSALKILVLSGFEEDSRVLLRTLVENIILLSYISAKPEERIRLFIEYQYVIWHRTLNKLDLHYSDNPKVSEERRSDITKNYERVKGNYKVKSRWHEKNLRSIAEELGPSYIYWYDVVYNMDSSYVHSDVSSSKGLLRENNENLQIAVGPLPFIGTDIISKAAELTRGMLLLLSENWSMPKDEIIDTWANAHRLIVKEFEQRQ